MRLEVTEHGLQLIAEAARKHQHVRQRLLPAEAALLDRTLARAKTAHGDERFAELLRELPAN